MIQDGSTQKNGKQYMGKYKILCFHVGISLLDNWLFKVKKITMYFRVYNIYREVKYMTTKT